MITITQDDKILTKADVILVVWLTDDAGNKIANPTDFHLRFFVRNRTAEVVCSREGGGTPENCEIDAEGNIQCFLPKNTFVPGPLWMEDMDVVPCSGFDDGTFENIGRHDLKITYIE
jgi:hypothetical protein